MNILVLGSDQTFELVKQKAGDKAQVLSWEGSAAEFEVWSVPLLVIDYFGTELPMLDLYSSLPAGSLVLLPVTDYALFELKQTSPDVHVAIAGFNHWSDQIANQVIELSAFGDQDRTTIEQWMNALDWDHEILQDQIGLVTQRVIAMVINEAFITLQEGTASAQDIDKSMKLGVNYPYGPFEWGQKIGYDNVLNLLDSLRSKTGDPRYNASLLLRHEVAKLAMA